jgi:predicted metal-dependent hydrolase
MPTFTQLNKKIKYLIRLRVRTSKRKKKVSQNYLKHKQKALGIVQERLQHFNKFYGYKWNRIFIKNQKTRWGSCSKKGNLNFNYRIALLPPEAADYIIVHELCHLKEFNHSQNFWNLVKVAIPNYKEIRNNLKNNRFILS